MTIVVYTERYYSCNRQEKLLREVVMIKKLCLIVMAIACITSLQTNRAFASSFAGDYSLCLSSQGDPYATPFTVNFGVGKFGTHYYAVGNSVDPYTSNISVFHGGMEVINNTLIFVVDGNSIDTYGQTTMDHFSVQMRLSPTTLNGQYRSIDVYESNMDPYTQTSGAVDFGTVTNGICP